MRRLVVVNVERFRIEYFPKSNRYLVIHKDTEDIVYFEGVLTFSSTTLRDGYNFRVVANPETNTFLVTHRSTNDSVSFRAKYSDQINKTYD